LTQYDSDRDVNRKSLSKADQTMHQLQNVSRREFLIASAAASSGVLWNRHGSAHEAANENQKFALHSCERENQT